MISVILPLLLLQSKFYSYKRLCLRKSGLSNTIAMTWNALSIWPLARSWTWEFMLVLNIRKSDEVLIKCKCAIVSHYNFVGAQGRRTLKLIIRPEFELVRELMPCLVTCKSVEDPIKTIGAVVSTIPFSNTSLWETIRSEYYIWPKNQIVITVLIICKFGEYLITNKADTVSKSFPPVLVYGWFRLRWEPVLNRWVPNPYAAFSLSQRCYT